MSKELMYVLIAKMHIKMNKIIEHNNFNLLSEEVQRYSRRLDRALVRYNKSLSNAKKRSCRHCSCKKEES